MEYGEVLKRTTVEKERMERELEIAYEIQQGFLSQTLPEVPGAEIAATMHPTREVGGDFYDVIPLSGGRVGVLVADVSDKGMPAALYMALARTLLRAHSLSARPQYLSDALESAQVRRLMRTGSLGALELAGLIGREKPLFKTFDNTVLAVGSCCPTRGCAKHSLACG